MTTAAKAFDNGKVLVGYLPAGYPDKRTAIAALRAMAQAGAGVIEIGLPYSDPLMDGPVVADAVHHALTGGTRIKDVFDTVEAVAAEGVPALVMTYWNPIDHYGVDAFARDLANAGGAGLITPDLPPEEAGDWLAASQAYDLDRVFLVAPSSTDDRLRAITAGCRGFVYAASLMGVTGTRDAVSAEAAGLVARTKKHTSLPVAVGLGVKDPAQAREVASFADGVIVGSAFVRAVSAPAGVEEVRILAAHLADAIAENNRP
jgi:tryptophan synthase alpha chain